MAAVWRSADPGTSTGMSEQPSDPPPHDKPEGSFTHAGDGTVPDERSAQDPELAAESAEASGAGG